MRTILESGLSSAGRGQGLRPALLLFMAAVLIPTACVLWFMNKAMQNERLALSQHLAEAYSHDLINASTRLDAFWESRSEAIRHASESKTAPACFEECVIKDLADSVICFDDNLRVSYPNTAIPPSETAAEDVMSWAKAVQLESAAQTLPEAAEEYRKIAEHASDPHTAARALQAQARCLMRSGTKERAIEVLTVTLAQDRYQNAVDGAGRLIVANAELMALESMDSNSSLKSLILERLEHRLNDYQNATLAGSQRRFLIQELLRSFPGRARFPTGNAEELAERYLENYPSPTPAPSAMLQRTSLPDVWQLSSADGRIIGLYRTQTLLASLQEVIAESRLPDGGSIELIPPGEEKNKIHFLSEPAGRCMAGWRVAIPSRNPKTFDIAAEAKMASYVWTGVLMLCGIALTAVLAARLLQKQVQLTHLKNDLVATVSHELKTPLSSMRLLVDTLLNTEHLPEQTVREYLQLISQENHRLSRLIENFLTFSRMERNKYAFDFSESSAAAIAESAARAVKERFNTPDCHFSVQIANELPGVVADADALVTALINLLDNAFKYTGQSKSIRFHVYRLPEAVAFEVKDNGIGLSPRELKKIFQRFYQVDQSLSRNTGGCGLGLSIVDFIVRAHHGRIEVESQPGQGSTFAVIIPVSTNKHSSSPGSHE